MPFLVSDQNARYLKAASQSRQVKGRKIIAQPFFRISFELKNVGGGRLHSAEVAYLLLTQAALGSILSSPKNISLDAAEIY